MYLEIVVFHGISLLPVLENSEHIKICFLKIVVAHAAPEPGYDTPVTFGYLLNILNIVGNGRIKA